ncbi:MAG: hypothetical protein U5K37_04935 [Natrialbaceae archaeon]|nr:hypothetical protein [Natrialbaceae archaeon]
MPATVVRPAFHATSTKQAKRAVEPVSSRRLLDALAALPIYRWRFTGQESNQHVGPMAEAFHDRLGIMGSNQSIASVDADGVILAAIAALADRLHQRGEELREEAAALDAELDTLEERVASLAAQLDD